LADGVVDFVGARVVQVFALEKNLRATLLTANAGSVVNGRGASDKVGQLVVELGHKSGVELVLGVSRFELVDGVGERLRDKTAAVNAKVATGIGLLVVKHG